MGNLPSVDELALRQNAVRGAELLDDHIPEWQWQVNPHSFDVRDSTKCIGGQVGWEKVKSILNHHQMVLSDAGMFRLVSYSGDPNWEETYTLEYGILQDQWMIELQRRRNGG